MPFRVPYDPVRTIFTFGRRASELKLGFPSKYMIFAFSRQVFCRNLIFFGFISHFF